MSTLPACCEEWEKQTTSHEAFAGGGFLYPSSMRPLAQIEPRVGTWSVNGCCGGGCCVLTGVKFCPFCGADRRFVAEAVQAA